MKKIYIHPNASEKFVSFNPYISNLCQALNRHCEVVNHNTKSNNGILHLVKYLPKLDYVWFNWVEDLPDKSKGYLQTGVLILIVLYCKITSRKIVWTLHNKFSHYKKNQAVKRFLYWLLMKQSNYILTHSTEGVKFAGSYGRNVGARARFFHHPVKGSFNSVSKSKTTDILIWGSIIPYKGIDLFLDYLWSQKLEHRWTIRIIGRIPDDNYREKLLTLANEKITIENKFIDNDILQQEIDNSKCVLFTYLKDSVLSSGAVMDSIVAGAYVIGPDCGAFSDLCADGVTDTYNSFEELVKLLENLDLANRRDQTKVKNFIENNNWESFGSKVAAWLKF